MGHSVTFYTSTANVDALDKSGGLTAIGTATTVNAPHRIDTLAPVLTVAYNSDLYAANYMYVPDFGRYYFITSIATDTAGRMVINGRVDVLYSWKNAIENVACTVVRSESSGVTYVPDNKLPVDTSRFYTVGIKFPNSIENTSVTDSRHYIVIVNNRVGGGS